jgi:hypothetical protein
VCIGGHQVHDFDTLIFQPFGRYLQPFFASSNG